MKKSILIFILLLVWIESYAPVYANTTERVKQILTEVHRINKFRITKHVDKVSEEFQNKVKFIAEDLDIPADWLMDVMWIESRLNSKCVNSIGATGLIQFLPSTAKGLKTNTKALYAMTNIEQLDYVHKFYKSAKGKIHEKEDLHLYAFFPLAILNSWSDNAVLKTSVLSPQTIASNNPLLDSNKDGKITVKEFKSVIFYLNL